MPVLLPPWQMFEMAISEFSILTDITILELEKQIQLQLNPFLVDKKVLAVGCSYRLAAFTLYRVIFTPWPPSWGEHKHMCLRACLQIGSTFNDIFASTF